MSEIAMQEDVEPRVALAAVLYHASGEIDPLLASVARRLKLAGYRVGGIVQARTTT